MEKLKNIFQHRNSLLFIPFLLIFILASSLSIVSILNFISQKNTDDGLSLIGNRDKELAQTGEGTANTTVTEDTNGDGVINDEDNGSSPTNTSTSFTTSETTVVNASTTVNTTTQSVDEKVVLCFGDSVTYGYPYGGGSSYPGQLQSKLNNAYGSGKVTVINLGVNGYTAEEVLASAQGWLTTYNPDLVLLMVGGNDLNQGLNESSTYEEILAVVNQTANEVVAIKNTVKSHINPNSSHPQIIVSAFIPNNYFDIWGSTLVSYYNSVLSSKGLDGYFTSNWSDLYDAGTMQAKTTLMSDSLHPNTTGYAMIADNWYPLAVARLGL